MGALATVLATGGATLGFPLPIVEVLLRMVLVPIVVTGDPLE
jgi:hypothetical protein